MTTNLEDYAACLEKAAPGDNILVVGFGSSSALASAYGVAVTTTMLITTLLFFVVARERWRWSPARALTVCGAFLVVDALADQLSSRAADRVLAVETATEWSVQTVAEMLVDQADEVFDARLAASVAEIAAASAT